MSDAELRDLERAVEASPKSEDPRRELATAMIRAARGHLLWWAAPGRVHPSATKIRLESKFQNPLTKQWHTDGLTGWGLAVSSVQDLIDLSSMYRTATLLDLPSGRWVRLQGRAAREDQKIEAKPQGVGESAHFGLTHQGGLESPEQEEHAPFDLPGGPWGGLVGGDPGPPPNFSRWRSEPLFDTEHSGLPRSGPVEINLFQNFGMFQQLVGDHSGQKIWGVDTNLMGSGGCLPQTCYAQVLGLSVFLLGLDRKPLPRDVAERIGQLGSVHLESVHTTISSIPLEEALSNVPGEGSEAAVIPWQPPPMFPFAWPLELQPLTAFRVRLWLGHIERPFFVKCVLHTFVAKGFLRLSAKQDLQRKVASSRKKKSK